MERSAIASMNGYMYQRYQAIDLYLCHKNGKFIEIEEEGSEDVDLHDADGCKHVYQIKYYRSGNKESLTWNKKNKSGLFKVIEDHWKTNEIKEIHMLVYSSNECFSKALLDIFNTKNFDFLAKYMLMLFYKNLDDQKQLNESDRKIILINAGEKLIELFEKNRQVIEKVICKNNKAMYDFFSDKNKYIPYFEKFKLTEAPDFHKLYENINNKIKNDTDFKTYFDGNMTEDYTQIKADFIINKIMLLLNCRMFNGKTRMRMCDITSEINNYMKKLSNPPEILKDYFRSLNNLFVPGMEDNEKKEVANVIDKKLLDILDTKNNVSVTMPNLFVKLILESINIIVKNKGNPAHLKMRYIKIVLEKCGDSNKLSNSDIKHMLTHLQSLIVMEKYGSKQTEKRRQYIDKLIPENDLEKQKSK